jgi:hypothetical protein
MSYKCYKCGINEVSLQYGRCEECFAERNCFICEHSTDWNDVKATYKEFCTPCGEHYPDYPMFYPLDEFATWCNVNRKDFDAGTDYGMVRDHLDADRVIEEYLKFKRRQNESR